MHHGNTSNKLYVNDYVNTTGGDHHCYGCIINPTFRSEIKMIYMATILNTQRGIFYLPAAI